MVEDVGLHDHLRMRRAGSSADCAVCLDPEEIAIVDARLGASEAPAPRIKRLPADAVLLRDLRNGRPFRLADDANHLLFTKSTLSHVLSKRGRARRMSDFYVVRYFGGRSRDE